MPTIEIYPDVPKPRWVKVGVKCFCLGEARDVFVIVGIHGRSVELETLSGGIHGLESFTKIHRGSHFPKDVRQEWIKDLKD